MSRYLDRLRAHVFSESALPPSVESVGTPKKASIETLDTTPRVPFQKNEGAPDPATHRQWTIVEPDGNAWTASFNPPATEAEVQGWYPGATVEPADGPAPAATTKADPRMALYRRWLAGIDEPRVLMTLDAAQVREAIAAGVVSRDLARASVLLLVKVPKGEAGPGACGLLAVPAGKWSDFSPQAAAAALQAWH